MPTAASLRELYMTQVEKLSIERDLLPATARKSPPDESAPVPFGLVNTNHILVCDFIADKGGWQRPKIQPFGNFQLSPTAMALHYGQLIFEGLKAYRGPDGHKIYLFRPDMNAKRFANSARKLAMAQVPEQLFVEGIRELVRLESEWVLNRPGSLYIRPLLIPLDEGVTYRAAKNYRFFVMACPAKAYYARETAAAVYVERSRVRAFPGGVGDAKCAGNYAAALLGLEAAKSAGADQVLWLDGIEHRFVEEVGAMNVMFVYGDRIVTPRLTGSILPGVTRDSILTLGRSLGLAMSEEKIDIADILNDARSGRLLEMFGCGTAAAVTPVDALISDGESIPISGRKIGETTMKIKNALLDIQHGAAEDPFHWRLEV